MAFTPLLKLRQRLLKNVIEQQARLVRTTRKASRQIYDFTINQSPRLMRITGRLREVSFRHDGGGTGKINDIDEHDRDEGHPYRQLIVWDPQKAEIIGGYRYFKCKEAPKGKDGAPDLSTAKYFLFSQEFINEYLPSTMELGRSFIPPEYQAGKGAVFSLDNLWDGLGALIVEHPDVDYFFGKMTEYEHKNKHSHDLIHTWLKSHFADEKKLVVPKPELEVKPGKLGRHDQEALERILAEHDTVAKQYKALDQYLIKTYDEHIPRLFGAYANLSDTMKVFGTARNNDFGGVLETGILITIKDIHEDTLRRYTEYDRTG